MQEVNGLTMKENSVLNSIKAMQARNAWTVSKACKKGHEYVDIATAFDTENTSAYRLEDGSIISTREYNENIDKYKKVEKVAWCYIWTFKIFDEVFFGRDLDYFKDLLKLLAQEFRLYSDPIGDTSKKMVIYVHNLPYDFQFFRKYLEIDDVFARDKREPLKATSDCFDFKCSLALSQRSLAQVAKNLTKHNLKKLKGDLDYELIRHSDTPLTDKEMAYCVEDVNIVQAYIDECLEEFGSIGRICLTNTGRVRRFVRAKCFYKINKKGKSVVNYDYKKLIKASTMGIEEYLMLREAFAGGFTHGNVLYIDEVIDNVKSKDFTSSYPANMIIRKYPMGKGRRVYPKTSEELRKYLNKYQCLLTVRLHNIKVKNGVPDGYLSESKVHIESTNKDATEVNNGRIWACDCCTVTITNVDLDIIEKCYDIESKEMLRMYVYNSEYLPNEYRRAILELYQQKTTLKNVKGREADYMLYKGMANSSYGMLAQDPINPDIFYDDKDGWVDPEKKTQEFIKEALEDYNKDDNRFTCYAWGVWVTAWSRWCLWSGILEMGSDYIYSDTDSIKYIDWKLDMDNKGYFDDILFNRYLQHEMYFEQYNKDIENKMHNACKALGLNDDSWNPQDIDGERHPLGVWDDDGEYEQFKTLGAKRYMYTSMDTVYDKATKKPKIDAKTGEVVKEKRTHLTLAGVSKSHGCDYIVETAKDNDLSVFDVFSENLEIDKEHTGKLTHTYIDQLKEGKVIDYLGNKGYFKAPTSVHMDKTSFKLSMSEYFKFFINKMKKGSHV